MFPGEAARSIAERRCFDLVPAVSRITAILLNGLDLINMNGPKLPSTGGLNAAVQLLQSGRGSASSYLGKGVTVFADAKNPLTGLSR